MDTYYFGATEPVNRIHKEGCRFAGRRTIKWPEVSDPEAFVSRLARVHRSYSLCSFCCKEIKLQVEAAVEERRAQRSGIESPVACAPE